MNWAVELTRPYQVDPLNLLALLYQGLPLDKFTHFQSVSNFIQVQIRQGFQKLISSQKLQSILNLHSVLQLIYFKLTRVQNKHDTSWLGKIDWPIEIFLSDHSSGVQIEISI